MSHQSLISVIIPVYNGERFLAEAVESVRKQLYAPLEIIIVDDGSTDSTAAAASSLAGADLSYVCQPNGGPSKARNHGLALAHGEVLGFLDADDVWPAGRLTCLLRRLEEDPSIDVVLGRTQCVRETHTPGGTPQLEECAPRCVLLTPTAAVFRRRVFERVGGFDETLRYGEDGDWFMRAREAGVPIVVLDDVTLFYRRHEHNMTRGKSLKELRVVDVLKRSLDRRRRERRGDAISLPGLLTSATQQPAGGAAVQPSTFFQGAHRIFERAEATGRSVERWYAVAGQTLRLRFADSSLVPPIAPALEHLAATPAAEPDLTICLWDVEHALPDVPAPPWRVDGTQRPDEAGEYGDGRFRSTFDFEAGVLSVLDAAANLALYCVRDAQRLPGYERAAPLRPILNWWMRGRGWQFMHGAAVGYETGGVLVVGAGGSGKSTTALTCLGTDLLYASDDYCLISTAGAPHLYSLYNSARLYEKDLYRFPRLALIPTTLDPGADKVRLFLHDHFKHNITTGFPLRAILLPEVTGLAETSLCRISPETALTALAARTQLQVPGADRAALATLADAARLVPCYRMRLGTRLSAIPDAIQDLLSTAIGVA